MNSSGRLLVVLILLFALLVMSRPAPLRVAAPPTPAAPTKPSECLLEQWRTLNDRLIDAEIARDRYRPSPERLQREIANARRAVWKYLKGLEAEPEHAGTRVAELQARLAEAEETDLPGLAQEAAALQEEFREACDPDGARWFTADHLIRQLRLKIDELNRAEYLGAVADAEAIELRAAVTRFRQDHLWLAEGTVTELLDGGRIRVSLGTADGIQRGHVLFVPRSPHDSKIFRGGLTVADVSPDGAVCRPQLDIFPLRPGDRVVLPYPEPLGGGTIHAIVLAVSGGGLFEISMGSDDGLNKGATLNVYRADGATYLGKARVVDTRPDRSVCQIVEGTQQGVVTKGDRVTHTVPGHWPY